MKKINFTGAREWKDEFSFLAKNGLDHLYLMLLGMAKSKADIRRLHGLLDTNVRLMRPELIKLENFWEKYIFSERTDGQRFNQHGNLDNETLKWLFATQCGGKNNSEYYLNYLLSFGTVPTLPIFEPFDYKLVCSTEERLGCGRAHFYTYIFNATFLVECCVSNNKNNITICFVIEKNYLTEELTYKLSQMPDYTKQGGFSNFSGSAYLVINMPAVGLIETLVELPWPNCHGCSYYLAGDEFVSNLKNKLIEIGVPVDGLFPFLV